MKTPKVKRRVVSMHSRAARRAGSPGVDVDKSLLALDRPEDAKEYTPKVLGVQNGGISKKKRTKPLTRQQRLRQQRGMDRADANQGKLEKKVENSVVRSKRIKDRAAAWEELNEQAANTVPKDKPKFARVVEVTTEPEVEKSVPNSKSSIEAALDEVAGSKPLDATKDVEEAETHMESQIEAAGDPEPADLDAVE